MVDNKQFQQVHEASWDLVNSLRDSSQTVVDNIATIQERNLKFAQGIFLGWMELLTQRTESRQRVQQQWGQQARKQLDASRRLASNSMQIYMDLFLTPFSFPRQVVDAAETAMRQEREAERRAAR